MTTTSSLVVTGDVDVDGHTNLDNVSVAGVSTFASNLNIGGDLQVTGNSLFVGVVMLEPMVQFNLVVQTLIMLYLLLM